MSLTPHIHYVAHKDQIKGFACNDPKKFSNHALVFMIKGIKKNFKQPVAFYFTNNLTKIQLKHFIKDVVKQIQSTGLHLLCMVCDQSPVNVSAINELVQETKCNYLKNDLDYKFQCNMIEVSQKQIICIYDVPHLMKGFRNNLIGKDLKYKDINKHEEFIVKWCFFEQLYEADKSFVRIKMPSKIN